MREPVTGANFALIVGQFTILKTGQNIEADPLNRTEERFLLWLQQTAVSKC